jgi:hypothetical protein
VATTDAVGGPVADGGTQHRNTTDPEDVRTMFTSSYVTADLAADHTRALLAEADAYRMARSSRSTREVSRRPWAWPRLRARTRVAVSGGST